MPQHTKRNLIIGAAALAVAAGVVGVTTPANPQPRRYGLNVEMREPGEIFIANTGDPSIARSAGVQPGDIIIAVNGVAVSELSREQIAQAMRASPVTLRLRRGSEEFDLRMTFD